MKPKQLRPLENCSEEFLGLIFNLVFPKLKAQKPKKKANGSGRSGDGLKAQRV